MCLKPGEKARENSNSSYITAIANDRLERTRISSTSSPHPDSVDLSLPSATDRRRSLISERPRTSTTILRSYSSSSFESPDDNSDSEDDWDDDSEAVESSKQNTLQ